MEHWANFGTAVVALLAAVLGLGQYWRSRREKQEVIGRAFAEVLRGLGSESPVERVASAALTRRFFDPKSEFGLRGLPYASHAVRVISAVLRSEPTGPTQKLLADGLREAPSLAYADLQRVNLQNCYWGAARDAPPVDATGADFFGADLSAASLRRAILRRAKFRNAVLRDTVLEDADCTEADFRGAVLCDASFSGAKLFGAKFEDSRHVPPIITAGLADGVFTSSEPIARPAAAPQNQPSATRVFISAPSSLTAADNSALQQVVLGVSQAGAEVVRHLPADYGVSSPLSDVARKIRDSDGVVIFGPPQFRVTTEKNAVSQNNPEVRMLSTPWNQLEAGIVYAMEKPLLILLQGAHGGVFDIPDNPNAITVIDVQGPDALIEICSKAANWAHLLSRTSSTVAR